MLNFCFRVYIYVLGAIELDTYPIFFNRQIVFFFVCLSSLPVAHLSDAPRRRVVVTKLLRAPPGSLTCSVYSTVTRDLGLTSDSRDN